MRNEGLFPKILYSHVTSAAFMIVTLWLAYTFSKGIIPIAVTSICLVSAAIIGSAVFAHDLSRNRHLSREAWGLLLVIVFAMALAIVSALTLLFVVQGDAFGYYVPIGRYLNQNPGAYITSPYRFSLSRNFGYFALYAHADLLGGSASSYLLLPIPFLLGTIAGVITLSRKQSSSNIVPSVATTCYVFSVFFGLLLKYNTFYLGNLLMASMALYYCYFLLTGAKRVFEKLVLPFSTFAALLLYDFTLLLLVPLALGYVAYRRPKLAFYVAASLAIPLVMLVSTRSVPLEFAQLPQLDLQSSLAFGGLVIVVLAGICGGKTSTSGTAPISLPAILAYLAAGASLLVQRIVDLYNYGFMTLSDYPLSSAVVAYMNRGYWFYQTPPNIVNTVLSIFFSDIFFGWGLAFTVYGLYLNRGKPVATFFLAVLPLTMLVETINNNYFRFASFLPPLIVVFLAIGLYTLVRRNALLVGVSLSFVSLLEKAVTTYPRLDLEHTAIMNPYDLALLGATALFFAAIHATKRYPLTQSVLSAFKDRVPARGQRCRNLVAKLPIKSIAWRQTTTILILFLCISVLTDNVLASRYSAEVNNSDASFVDQHVLPLIQDRSTLVTVELIHPNFNFYKDVVVVPMAQPWILEGFLDLGLTNASALLSWLSSNGINYLFVDRGLTSGNQDVFGLFDQLAISCSTYPQCAPLYDDGRFVLVRITL